MTRALVALALSILVHALFLAALTYQLEWRF